VLDESLVVFFPFGGGHHILTGEGRAFSSPVEHVMARDWRHSDRHQGMEQPEERLFQPAEQVQRTGHVRVGVNVSEPSRECSQPGPLEGREWRGK
jgi:hypothetical protein